MKRINLLLLFFTIFNSFIYAQPTDNPFKDFYNTNEEYPTWTREINWPLVIDMSQYDNGADNYEKFKNACDSLYSVGGGVLYYPAGTYHFDIPDGPNDEGLMLKEGVVIRGEKPSVDQHAVVTRDVDSLYKHGLTSNPTKFIFSRKDFSSVLPNVSSGPANVPKMWNMIGCKPSTVSHVGVVWVEVEYGYIFFGFNSNNWGSTWATAGSWMSDKAFNGWGERVPDGTHPMDFVAGVPANAHSVMGEKRFIMGVHLKNSCVPNYVINKAQLPDFELEHGSYRFNPKLCVYGRHVFIANNCISKPDTSIVFRYDMKAEDRNTETIITVQQIFDPGKGGGIDVNKSHISHFVNKCDVDDPNTFYANDVIIIDNWVYNHSNKGYEFAGKWSVVKGNVNYREYYGLSDPYGTGGALSSMVHSSSGRAWSSENHEDFMSRFMDYGGWNNWIHNNRWTGTGSIGNDGEGILCQRHTGVEVYSVAKTYNKQGSTGEEGYIAPYDVHCVGLFHGWNVIRGGVGIYKTDVNYGADASTIQNTELNGTPIFASGTGGTYIIDFLDADCPLGTTPGKPSITLTEEIGYVDIQWDDVENEVAYRVDRKKVGSSEWFTIAYRPRQETGGSVTFAEGERANGYIYTTANYHSHDSALCWDGVTRNMNKPKWRDYMKKDNKFYYRVIAISCDDLGTESDVDSSLVDMNSVASEPIAYKPFTVDPNPVINTAYMNYSLDEDETATISLYDIKGNLLKKLAHNTREESVSINRDNIGSGTYIIQLKTNKDVVTNRKIIFK